MTLHIISTIATRSLIIYILLNFTWQEYRSYFWWKSEYRVISDQREYTAQVSFTSLKTKSEGSNKAVFFIPLDLRTSRLQGKILTVCLKS
jgi:hypothetical protein